jgi:hypothetical protein
MFLIVPKREEFERVSGWRFFKGRRRWLEGELDEGIVKELNKSKCHSHALRSHRGFIHGHGRASIVAQSNARLRSCALFSLFLCNLIVLLLRGQSWPAHGSRSTRVHHPFQ